MRPHARHALAPALKVADGDELNRGEKTVNLAKLGFVHVVHGVNEFALTYRVNIKAETLFK